MSKQIVAKKVCPSCRAEFGRHRYPGGKLETMHAFSRRRFCGTKCGASVRSAKPFWDYVNKSGGPDACWPWTGALSTGGYGAWGLGRKHRIASRVAYELSVGSIPKSEGYHGTLVLHSCDNRKCCNPAHLRLGSVQDNTDDMVKRGRGWWQCGARA